MAASSSDILRRFPLHDLYVERNAKIGAFGKWEVPLYFSGILDEHEAVRTDVGLFDISHMGEFFFSGPRVVEALEAILPRSVSTMEKGQALYMPLLNHQAGIIDDIILYRLEEGVFWMIVNAGNVDRDEEWIKSNLAEGACFENLSDQYGLLALQGPKSGDIIAALYGADYSNLGYYRFAPFKDGMISRTGYTGEDGFEIMVKNEDLPEIWHSLVEEGKKYRLKLIGFGARDTLRLEAGMLLHGHDMNDRINPIEARMDWAVSKTKENYIGSKAITVLREEGVSQKLIGFEMIERGISREGCEIHKDGEMIGRVTSGSFSPTLKKNIGLGYVAAEQARVGNEVQVMIREKPVNAKIVKLPFYKRKNDQ